MAIRDHINFVFGNIQSVEGNPIKCCLEVLYEIPNFQILAKRLLLPKSAKDIQRKCWYVLTDKLEKYCAYSTPDYSIQRYSK